MGATVGSKSYQFRMERQDGWLQLEDLVTRAEKSGIRSLSATEVFELPHLYKGALSSLSVARAISLDRNVVEYLENLTARAYFLLYGQQRSVGDAFSHLMRVSIPAAVRSIYQEFIVAVVVFLLGLFAAFYLVHDNPDWYFTFVDAQLADGRQPGASAEELRDVLYPKPEEVENLDVFSTFLFTHNARIGLLMFALGFALGLPTLWLLFSTGTMIGGFLALYDSKGLLMELGGWLIIHGSTEILAVILCGAAGLSVARHYIFPGKQSRLEALAFFGRRAAIVAFCCILMFMVAGLLEGFARQLVTNDTARYTTGLVMFAAWMLYFNLGGRRQRDGTS